MKRAADLLEQCAEALRKIENELLVAKQTSGWLSAFEQVILDTASSALLAMHDSHRGQSAEVAGDGAWELDVGKDGVVGFSSSGASDAYLRLDGMFDTFVEQHAFAVAVLAKLNAAPVPDASAVRALPIAPSVVQWRLAITQSLIDNGWSDYGIDTELEMIERRARELAEGRKTT